MLACLHVCVLTCLACLRACVLTYLACLRACVLTCLRAHVFGVLTCLRAYVFGVFTCLRAWRAYVLAWLRAWCVCVCKCVFVCLICFAFQYLNLKILTAKKLCALLSWTYFLFTFWYQLIKLYETNLRVAGKSIDISYSYSCSKAISIFYNLYIRLLH